MSALLGSAAAGKPHHHLDPNQKKINTETKNMIDIKGIKKILKEIETEEMIKEIQ